MTDITYASYQTFPSDAANSLQTITNLKYLVRAGHDIRLVFPNRRLNSSGKLNVLQNHYEFSENFEVEIKNFVQVCPKEMINKLKNPITFKSKIKEVS